MKGERQMITYIVFFIAGVITGLFLTYGFLGADFGKLRIDQSDDQPYLFLEINGSMEELLKKDRITLKVEARDYLKTRD